MRGLGMSLLAICLFPNFAPTCWLNSEHTGEIPIFHFAKLFGINSSIPNVSPWTAGKAILRPAFTMILFSTLSLSKMHNMSRFPHSSVCSLMTPYPHLMMALLISFILMDFILMKR